MRIVGIFALWALLVISNIANANVRGFKITAWQDCTRESECKAMEPKEWTSDEINFLDTTFSEFKKNGLKHLIEKVESLNFILERITYWQYVGFTPENPLGSYFRNEFVHAITLHNSEKNIIAFSDRFFSNHVGTDTTSGLDFKKITLLHELVHAYDSDLGLSKSAEFRRLSGFSNPNETDFDKPVYLRASSEDLDQVDKQIKALTIEGREFEARRIDREFGIKHGLPRYYSTTDPDEALADLATFIYFDKTAPTYINPGLISFIDKNILKGARATQ